MIKIINNGNGCVFGTKIVDAETGEDTKLAVTGLTIDMECVDAVVVATMKVALVQTEVTVGKAEWLTQNPATGAFEAISAIHFRDGSSVTIGEDGTPTRIPAPLCVSVVGDQSVHKFRGKPA